MDPVTAILVAGFGSAFLTAVVGFGVAIFSAWLSKMESRRQARREAYARLISATGLVMQTATTVREAMRFRSGWKEGVDVTFGYRKLLDPLDVHQLVRMDLGPVSRAWADVLTIGTPEAVDLGNRLVVSCGRLMNAATSRGLARTWFSRHLLGEKWTQAQVHELDERIDSLAALRRQLVDAARREIGIDVVELVPPPAVDVDAGSS